MSINELFEYIIFCLGDKIKQFRISYSDNMIFLEGPCVITIKSSGLNTSTVSVESDNDELVGLFKNIHL